MKQAKVYSTIMVNSSEGGHGVITQKKEILQYFFLREMACIENYHRTFEQNY